MVGYKTVVVVMMVVGVAVVVLVGMAVGVVGVSLAIARPSSIVYCTLVWKNG